MPNKIQFKRGLKAGLPSLGIGEPAFCTDTKELFMGTASGNAKMSPESINVKWFGAKGDNTTDDYSVINSLLNYIGSDKVDIYLPKGTYIIGTNITISANVNLIFANGAILAPKTGVTITLNCGIQAGLYQIFGGSGTISGKSKIDKIYPQWFGAKGDGTTDDAAAIQSAIDYALTNEKVIYFPDGKYIVDTGLIANYGRDYKPFKILGHNATLYYNNSSGVLLTINPVVPNTDTVPTDGIRFFSIEGINFDTSITGTTATALKIGKANYVCDSFNYNVIRDIEIQNFNIGIDLCARHVIFDNVVIRTPISIGMILIIDNNYFVGDVIFNKCEFCTGSDSAFKLYTTSQNGGSLRGLHFTNCVFYGKTGSTATINVINNGNAMIADIFFVACQFDQNITTGLSFANNGAGTIQNVKIVACYIVGGAKGIETSGCLNFVIANCNIFSDMAFNIYNTKNINICNNNIEGCTVESIFSGTSSNVIVLGNHINSTSVMNYMFSLVPSVLSAIISNNFGNYSIDFVENQTSLDATKLVNTNNLKLII